MDQLKKKQHYVWKEYLKPWCSDNKIFTYIKSSDKTIFSNLDGVAQERFYYSLEEFTIEEEMILKKIVRRFSTPDVVEMNLKFYYVIVSYSKIKRELSKKNLPKQYVTELNKRLNLLQRNTLEDFHTRVESLGKQLILSSSSKELGLLFIDGSRFLSFAFICMQYFRTKKMRLAYEGFAKNHAYLKEKYSHIISVVFANGLAWALASYQKCKIIFLTNQTGIPLITADQSAINLKLHIKNDRGHVGDFELYYPLTPYYALLIHVNEKENSINDYSLKTEEVLQFNQSIFDNSEKFVFGTKNFVFPSKKDCL